MGLFPRYDDSVNVIQLYYFALRIEGISPLINSAFYAAAPPHRSENEKDVTVHTDKGRSFASREVKKLCVVWICR